MKILAPAGSREQLVAAVRSGADAVYLGAGGLNARRNAENFSDRGSLREAVEYCHASGVDVHLTANILVRDDEWSQAAQLIEEACALGVDAVIVQDLGLARYIRSVAPELVMHASTQMSLHTPGGALAAGDYVLVSGKTLTGLTDCTLSHNIGGGMKVKLVRTESALVLRVIPSGITVIFR